MRPLFRLLVGAAALALALFLFTPDAYAQDATSPMTPTLTAATGLSDLVSQKNVWAPSLSPTGDRLAFFNTSGGKRGRDTQICIYDFAQDESACAVFPTEFQLYPGALVWSPDGASIAMSEDPFGSSKESDIWIYDVESQSFADKTDDGLTGSWRSLQSTQSVDLDYLPTWNPQDGSLYFWRAVPGGQAGNTIQLQQMDPSTGDLTLVADLSAALEGALPAFNQQTIALDGASVVSPDGDALAFLAYSHDQMGGQIGELWLVELTTAGEESASAVKLLDEETMSAALPPWDYALAVPLGLSWTADGAGVVVLSRVAETNSLLPLTLLHYVARDGSESRAVVDFSGVESESDLYAMADGGSLPWAAYSPLTAVLAPAGDAIWMVSDLGKSTGLLAAPLPPADSLPPLVFSSSQAESDTSLAASHAPDGKVVVYGYLIESE
jgi:Tol biopolymer transport system component